MYLLDSDVFLQAKNLHYGFDICPGFWEWLEDASRRGVLGSVAAVKAELVEQGDELSSWVKGHDGLFVPEDPATTTAMREVTAFAQSPRFSAAHRAKFLAKADPLLIACAKAHGHTVVTHEKSAPDSKKVKIPDVCEALGVPTDGIYQVIRNDGANFTFRSEQQPFTLGAAKDALDAAPAAPEML